MEKREFLSDGQRDLYKRFLITKDLEKVAELSGLSYSTVNNVLYQRTSITDENRKVIPAFNVVLKDRVKETVEWLHEAEKELAMNLVKNTKI